METFAPGDRVVAINLMPVPLYEDGDWSQTSRLLETCVMKGICVPQIAS